MNVNKRRYSIHACIFRCGYICMNMYRCNIDGGTRGVMVIVVGNEHGDTSSNPGRD